MRRDLDAMAQRPVDVLVVGGGATGACVAWDAAQRGLRVALVEKGDFSSGTSGASSRLLHGGLRYLQRLDVGVVRESLRERAIWRAIAPHLVEPVTFLLPTSGHGVRGRLVMHRVLGLYDRLARGRGDFPGHRVLGRAQTLALEPRLRPDGITGCVLYHDAMMPLPERLALACIQSAMSRGAQVANYAEVTSFLVEEGCLVGARVLDLLDGAIHDVRAAVVVNASGPWADRLLGCLPTAAPSRRRRRGNRDLVARSKGIHVVTRDLGFRNATVVRGGHRHAFILPWQGHSLIGTTDTPYRGNIDEVAATAEDVQNLLGVVTDGLTRPVSEADVLYAYAGVRPLVAARHGRGDDLYCASRRSEVLVHAHPGARGLVSAIGGKWTTSRALAEEVVDLLAKQLGRPLPPCGTREVSLHGGATGDLERFLHALVRRHPQVPRETLEHLLHRYGDRVDAVLAHAEPGDRPLAPGTGRHDLPCEVRYAVREEMALHLDDVVFRRTTLGLLGHPGPGVLECAAALMAPPLTWTAADAAREVESVRRRMTVPGASGPAPAPGKQAEAVVAPSVLSAAAHGRRGGAS